MPITASAAKERITGLIAVRLMLGI
jgi:hypothetical protein